MSSWFHTCEVGVFLLLIFGVERKIIGANGEVHTYVGGFYRGAIHPWDAWWSHPVLSKVSSSFLKFFILLFLCDVHGEHFSILREDHFSTSKELWPNVSHSFGSQQLLILKMYGDSLEPLQPSKAECK
jgi:hypothetical protein